jgi:hypothetical protein
MFSYQFIKYFLNVNIQMMQDRIHTELPTIVKMSPFWMPDTIKITPEAQNPIKAISSNFQFLESFSIGASLVSSILPLSQNSVICNIHMLLADRLLSLSASYNRIFYPLYWAKIVIIRNFSRILNIGGIYVHFHFFEHFISWDEMTSIKFIGDCSGWFNF